jgi:hypothetical protein
MDVRFIFDNPRVTPQVVADAVGVDLSTAYRWKHGTPPESDHLVKLFACGFITAKDMKRGGEAA